MENKEDLNKYCITCIIKKEENEKHCLICDSCIIGFDHHCQWINKCIGKKNHYLFLFFLIYLIINNGFYIFISIEGNSF